MLSLLAMYRLGLVLAIAAAGCGGKKDDAGAGGRAASDARGGAPSVAGSAGSAAGAKSASDGSGSAASGSAAGSGSAGSASAAADPGGGGAPSKVLQVVVRGTFGCARRADGKVRCWGGQPRAAGAVSAVPVELPNVTAVSVDISPAGEIFVVTTDGRVLTTRDELGKLAKLDELEVTGEPIEARAFGADALILMRTGDLVAMRTPSLRLTDITALRIAGDRGFALHRDGHVSAFTKTSASVVKGLTDIESLIDVGCGQHRGGAIGCWNDRGKTTPWNGPANALDRAAGDHFACDLTRSGVSCTGQNDHGQLGTGPGPDRQMPKLVDLPAKPVGLAVGARSACAVLENGDVACWGANDAGQLGDGTRVDRPTPVVIAGLTSPHPLPPADGTRAIGQASAEMSWDGMPEGCKRPATLARAGGESLASVVSAYAYVQKGRAALWFADYRLEPAGYGGDGIVARHGQRAFELRLTAPRTIDRGRYRDTGPRRASLVVHGETGAAASAAVDLVIERVDKAWICGQLLGEPRQPFAARIEAHR